MAIKEEWLDEVLKGCKPPVHRTHDPELPEIRILEGPQGRG